MRDINDFNLGFVEYNSTTPQAWGLYTVLPNSVLLCDGRVIATRLSDGACKAFGAEALIRRYAAGIEVLEGIPAAMNVWASAADETALSAVTVALYTDATQFGFLATGLATPMTWTFKMAIRGFTESE